MIKLIVALGNPGKDYEKTRHNIGFMVADQLVSDWSKKFKSYYASTNGKRDKIHWIKPQTYMNLSGEAVIDAKQFFKIEPDEILVLHDELDLPFGQIGLKRGGGLAGHNGLKSIAQVLGTQDFYRFRIGIGRPVHGTVSDFVLSEFSNDEKKSIDTYLKNCAEVVECIDQNGFEKAMSTFSRKSLI
jgi:PTH1 family peptidyl-tRNA hydrolase